MMREIKMRAWDISEEKMLRVKPMWAEIDGCDLIFMQSTGLQDKNGKEIFEGDICRNGDWDSNANSEIYREEVVEWVEGEACFRGFYFNHEGMTCEVIGNVHENPELIK